MARVSRRGGAPKRVSLPSAAELLYQMRNDLGDAGFDSIPIASSRAEFNKIKNLMEDDTNEIFSQYGPTKYQNLAGLPAEEYEQYYDRGGKIFSRQFYEVISLEDEDIDYVPGFQPDTEEDTSPADLTLVPTSSTNPERPRTVAAGYDEDEEKLTVMFRDGTLYNYYEVTKGEWQAFKANRSKGAFIYRVLDFKPRGYADDTSIGRKERQALYRFARGLQSYKGGKISGQSKATYKTASQAKRGRKK